MAAHYANLDWAIAERHIDLKRLSERTETRLREARNATSPNNLLPAPPKGVFGCTMEQLNKSPVTDTYTDIPGGLPYVVSGWNTCDSTWTKGIGQGALGPADPLYGKAGPPIALSLTGQGNASNGQPNPVPVANTVAEVGSLSNFRSDHPNGGLFLL